MNKQVVLVKYESTQLETKKEVEKLLHVQKIKQERLQQLINRYKYFENTNTKSRNLYYNLAALEAANNNQNIANRYLDKALELEPKLIDKFPTR